MKYEPFDLKNLSLEQLEISIMLLSDSYKHSHYKQYPPGTEYVYSYIESRGGDFDKTVFFGLQYFIKRYLLKPITMQDVEIARMIVEAHSKTFNYEGWKYIVEQHGGYLPLDIRAVPEGTVVDTKNVLVSVVNTDPKCHWLTSFVETPLLRAVWYGTTVATQSKFIVNDIIKPALEKTGDVSGLPFKLHDFGARGASSHETAMIGGMAHLINSLGSDTIEGTFGALKYYKATMDNFPSASIDASEHSTITSWTKYREADAYSNMINQFGDGMFACVSDSYNIFGAIDIWKSLESKLIEKGGTLIIRPDSGDPVDIICGLGLKPFNGSHLPIDIALDQAKREGLRGVEIKGSYYKLMYDKSGNPAGHKLITKAEYMGVIEYTMHRFGAVINDKGYAVLPDHIRIIQGDGVNKHSIKAILEGLESKKISADNIAFGMGGKLLQGVDRDTLKFAMKCSAIKNKDRWIDVFKDPITDPGKQSKKGVISLFKCTGGNFHTLRSSLDGETFGWTDKPVSYAMKTVFLDGKLTKEYTFEEVKANASA